MCRNVAHSIHGAGLGDCTSNRWFDKTLQVYVTESGENGLTNEHAPGEAVVPMQLVAHALHCA